MDGLKDKTKAKVMTRQHRTLYKSDVSAPSDPIKTSKENHKLNSEPNPNPSPSPNPNPTNPNPNPNPSTRQDYDKTRQAPAN